MIDLKSVNNYFLVIESQENEIILRAEIDHLHKILDDAHVSKTMLSSKIDDHTS